MHLFHKCLIVWVIDINDQLNWNINLSHKMDSVPCNDKCKINLRSFLYRTILTQALTQQFVCQIARYIFHFNQASKLLIAAFSLIYSMTSIKVVYVWCGSRYVLLRKCIRLKRKSLLLQGKHATRQEFIFTNDIQKNMQSRIQLTLP